MPEKRVYQLNLSDEELTSIGFALATTMGTLNNDPIMVAEATLLYFRHPIYIVALDKMAEEVRTLLQQAEKDYDAVKNSL